MFPCLLCELGVDKQRRVTSRGSLEAGSAGLRGSEASTHTVLFETRNQSGSKAELTKTKPELKLIHNLQLQRSHLLEALKGIKLLGAEQIIEVSPAYTRLHQMTRSFLSSSSDFKE
ncbi:hypothetical protein KOW79_019102 [Hemibagrus wyckioides]|uniref:Uncharacterized protein n=1 Tax=Hemibagrus wyckioides TaxID=337641 RepID=A0A9D3SBL8_9TELE|nr:hypothetical protein KOW79_019102 [Hemibagrus wyckioides]